MHNYLHILLKTLSEITKAKSLKQSIIIALILDYTNNYLTSQGPLVRIKIIDDTFTFEKKQSSKVYFQVHNLTDKKYMMKIGDIVYVKEFQSFKQDKPEIYEIETSSHIHVFEQNKSNLWCTNCQKNILLCEQSQKRIQDLRDYSFKKFSQIKLKDLYWKGFTNSDQVIKQNFDLLLKVDQIELVNLQDIPKYYNIRLVDSDLNQYYLKEQNNDLEVGEIVKIRSVHYLDKENQIIKSDYTNVQRLYRFFYDVVNFDKFKYEIVRYAKENYDFEEYYHDLQDENRKFSIIKRIHQNNYNITSLQFLLNKQQSNDYYSIKHMKYRIQCYVIDIQPSYLLDAVRRISYFDKKINYPLKDSNFKNMNQLKRILEVQILVKDTSIDLNKDVVNIILIQEELQNDHDFFKGVELLKIEEENVQEYQKVYYNILNRLFTETSSSKMVDIIVKPFLFQQKILYKIIDTQFLP
uniref:Pot2 n=1 Tax=Tetrahymena thermophila TaxID=5911 RepID=A0A097I9B2_TETTH|nr:Pot2 [Tetrahymena thermophila]